MGRPTSGTVGGTVLKWPEFYNQWASGYQTHMKNLADNDCKPSSGVPAGIVFVPIVVPRLRKGFDTEQAVFEGKTTKDGDASSDLLEQQTTEKPVSRTKQQQLEGIDRDIEYAMPGQEGVGDASGWNVLGQPLEGVPAPPLGILSESFKESECEQMLDAANTQRRAFLNNMSLQVKLNQEIESIMQEMQSQTQKVAQVQQKLMAAESVPELLTRAQMKQNAMEEQAELVKATKALQKILKKLKRFLRFSIFC